MPFSRYLKCFADPDNPDSLLLYSTKKGSVVKVARRLFADAKRGCIGDAEREALQRREIWIDDATAEREAMAGLVDRTNAGSSTFSATVALTMNCNLACPYCFEDRFRAGQSMSEETAQLLVDHVAREQIGKKRDVELRFYGGEPLLAVPRLKQIAGPLRDAAAAAGTKFSCSLVTNATLLTRPLVEQLIPFGLVSAQITLDGPAQIHDRQRPYLSGKGSFSSILANLLEVYDLVTLKPGGNFTRDNYRKFPAALDALTEAGIDPARVGPVQFSAIHPKSGGHDPQGASCFAGHETWRIEAHIFLREEILRRGFSVEPLTMGICMIELTNTMVVNWDGALYKCPVFMGWPELSIGSLAEGVKDYSASHNLGLWNSDECLDCAYLPLCFGGCRFVSKLKNGAIDRVDCRRNVFDATLEEMVLQDMRSKNKIDRLCRT